MDSQTTNFGVKTMVKDKFRFQLSTTIQHSLVPLNSRFILILN